MAKRLQGVLAIAHTPFTDDDRIDPAALTRAVDWSFEVGEDGLGTGMVSETLKLTADERVELPRLLVEAAAGRGPVFAAVGAEGTKQAVAFAVAAERVGCDGVMAVPPLSARPGVEQLTDYFRAIADAIAIPVIVQDASGYVGQAIPVGVYVKLLERYGPDKIVFKPEAAPNGPNISALRDATGGKARIFEGSGGVFLIDSHRRGIAGTMPGMDLLDGVVAVWKALQRGDEEAAYRAYFPVCAIVSLQLQAGLDGFLAVEKYLMVKRGLFPSARRRGPYGWELDAETAAEVDRLFERMRLAIGARVMRYTLLAFLCLVTLVAYLQRSALGVPSKAIEAELGITPQAMGVVWLAWYAGYAVFQIPAGWVADRLGSKPALILFTLLWSALTAVVGLATSFAELALFWALMGAAQAGIFPCATKAIGATFPKTEQGFASGLLACFMAGGAALSQEVTGRLLGPLTWQAILAVYAVPGLVWAAAFAVAVPSPDRPRPAPAEGPREPFDWTRLVADRDMVLLCLQQLMRAGATALFFTWFPRFLQETKGLSPAESGRLAAWPLLAGIVGALVGGTASDWLLRRTGRERLGRCALSAGCMAVAAGVSVSAYYATTAGGVVALVSLAAFCAYVGGPAAYAVALSMGGTRVALVFATMNMAGNVGAGFFPVAVGQLVGATGDWNDVILLFAGMFAAAGVCWALLDPTRTLYEEPT